MPCSEAIGRRRRAGSAASAIVEGGGFYASLDEFRPDVHIHIVPATVVCGGWTRLSSNGFAINSTFLRSESRGTVKLVSSDPP